MNEIIVIGGNHHNTLSVVRSLGFKGLRPILIIISKGKRPYISYSKYIKACIQLKHETELTDYLSAHYDMGG